VTDARWQLVAYGFLSIVLWMVAAQLARRRDISLARRLSTGWAASILRFVYYVGLPYTALVLGVLPGRYLGLVGLNRLQTGAAGGVDAGLDAGRFLAQLRDAASLAILDWLPSVGTLLSLGAVMLLVLSVAWLGYSRARRALSPAAEVAGAPFPLPSVVQVGYQAVHWSFYRSVAWLLTDDLYLAVVGGILLVGVEWLLDPGRMAHVQHSPGAEEPLLDASLLIATSVIFFFVPNLWLLVPVHWALAAASWRCVKIGEVSLQTR
jgi:hypothetical protein